MSLSSLNFRDLGGIRTEDGRRLRSGMLLRSEGPRNLTEPQVSELRDLGVKAVFDLRSVGERDEDPHAWHEPHCRMLHLDINQDLRAADRTEWARLRDNPDPLAGRQVMAQNYRAMPGALLPHWRPIVDTLLDGAVPALINCTAGKDRTGVAVALLLALLGAERQAIVGDYLKSDVFVGNMALAGSVERSFQESFGFVPAQSVIEAVFDVDVGYLNAAFQEVESRWGGIDRYFDAAGITAAEREGLRSLLLESA